MKQYLIIGFWSEQAFIGSHAIELERFDVGNVEYKNFELRKKVEKYLMNEFPQNKDVLQ